MNTSLKAQKIEEENIKAELNALAEIGELEKSKLPEPQEAEEGTVVDAQERLMQHLYEFINGMKRKSRAERRFIAKKNKNLRDIIPKITRSENEKAFQEIPVIKNRSNAEKIAAKQKREAKTERVAAQRVKANSTCSKRKPLPRARRV